ncbi:MAG: hypothetical protein ACQERE_03145 [Pseudomonadota bacterium]
MRTPNARKAFRPFAALTLLPLVASIGIAQDMANPETDADEARQEQEQRSQRTTQPLSLKIQEEGKVRMPRRGEHMDSVRSRFGEPEASRGPVGEPPITRWQYPEFVVIFEGQSVIDSVTEPDSND